MHMELVRPRLLARSHYYFRHRQQRDCKLARFNVWRALQTISRASTRFICARNRGISESFDDIIAFTDSDCIPQRSWISAGVKALKEATRPIMVGGPIVFDFGSNITMTTCELLDSIIHHRQTEYIFEHGFAATANLFVTRALISSHGQFVARFLSGGDREFGQRLASAGIEIVMAEDAIIVHPARNRLIDLLQKGLRGVGGEKTSLSVRKLSRWAI